MQAGAYEGRQCPPGRDVRIEENSTMSDPEDEGILDVGTDVEYDILKVLPLVLRPETLQVSACGGKSRIRAPVGAASRVIEGLAYAIAKQPRYLFEAELDLFWFACPVCRGFTIRGPAGRYLRGCSRQFRHVLACVEGGSDCDPVPAGPRDLGTGLVWPCERAGCDGSVDSILPRGVKVPNGLD